MRKSLVKKVSEIKSDAKRLGFQLDVNPTVDENSVLLANTNSKKVIILGEVNMFGQDIMVAYDINVRKWSWAESEGFNSNQIIDNMAPEIFSEISIDIFLV